MSNNDERDEIETPDEQDTVHIWQNERFYPMKGWSDKLLPTDRLPWSDKTGLNPLSMNGFLLPDHCCAWKSDWEININTETDQEGWYYGIDFTQSIRNCSNKKAMQHMCRRRKWVRSFIRNASVPVENLTSGWWCKVSGYGFPYSSNDSIKELEEQWRPLIQEQQHSSHLAWDQLFASSDFSMSRKDKPLQYFVRQHGIPQTLRGKLWLMASGAQRKLEENVGYYQCLLDTNHDRAIPSQRAIEADLDRTFCIHPYFRSKEGQGSLLRVLTALAWRNPVLGYCQSMNFIVALLLLNMDEERAFWLFVILLEDILPNDFFNSELRGMTVDCNVMDKLVQHSLPKLHQFLQQQGVDLALVTTNWFVSLLINVFPHETTLRIWDCMMVEGSVIVHRAILGFLKICEPTLINEVVDAASLMQVIQRLSTTMFDSQKLITSAISIKLAKHNQSLRLYDVRSHVRCKVEGDDSPRSPSHNRMTTSFDTPSGSPTLSNLSHHTFDIPFLRSASLKMKEVLKS